MVTKLTEITTFITEQLAMWEVKLLVGQDGIDPRGTFSEMRLLSDCGVTEADIIRGATIYPATWLGVEDRLGSITPGKLANILVLDKNPMADIDNMASTAFVIHRGKVVE